MSNYDYCIIGQLSVDYLLTASSQLHERLLGGGAAYSAVGARIWSESVGILCTIGVDFPAELLQQLETLDIRTEDFINRFENATNHHFIAYSQPAKRADVKATSMYVQLGRAIPKALLPGSGKEKIDTKQSTTSILPNDLPATISNCLVVHLAGVPANPAKLLGHHLNQLKRPFISYDPETKLMDQDFEEDLKLTLHDIDIFLPSERQCRQYFQPERPSLWEMMEAFAAMGPKVIVIKRGERGQAVYSAKTRSLWHIPPYPTSPVDVTGAGHVYCGAFAAVYGQNEDPVEAAISASAAASLAIEGVGISYPMEAMPGLAEARRERLRQGVQKA